MPVDARLDVNVALNRPSYQVSTWTDHDGIYYALYANDGGHGTHYLYGPCAHTNYATNPWWAVDLEAALYVDGVKFTNRDESCTYSLSSVYERTRIDGEGWEGLTLSEIFNRPVRFASSVPGGSITPPWTIPVAYFESVHGNCYTVQRPPITILNQW